MAKQVLGTLKISHVCQLQLIEDGPVFFQPLFLSVLNEGFPLGLEGFWIEDQALGSLLGGQSGDQSLPCPSDCPDAIGRTNCSHNSLLPGDAL